MTYKKTKIMFIISTLAGLFLQISLLYTPEIENELTYIYFLGFCLFCNILVLTFWYFDYQKFHNKKFFEIPLDIFLLIGYGMYFICNNNGVKAYDTKQMLLWIGVAMCGIAFIIAIRKKELKVIDTKQM